MPITAHKDPKLTPQVTLPEGEGWVNALKLFDAHVAETLVVAARTLYPHESLPDAVYRRTIFQFDKMASMAPVAAQSFAEFVDLLDTANPLSFRQLSESYRLAALRAIEGTTAFRLVQRSTVRFLYDDVEVWQAFGYEGASVQLGGYVNRGFNDLDWLPEPPAGI